MPLPALDIFLILPGLVLVLFRVTGMVMTAPVFGSPMIPMRIRAALAMVLSLVSFSVLHNNLPRVETLGEAIAGAAGELMIGAAIGLALNIVLLAGEVAGTLVGQQAGLVLGEVVNPLQEHQASVLGQIYTVVLTLGFLAAGGHRALVSAVLDSFSVAPVLSMRDSQSMLLLLSETLTAAFVAGIRLAGPAMIALFLAAISLAVLSRAMPQLNILTVGFTLKVYVALIVAWFTLSACEGLVLQTIVDALDSIRDAFGMPPCRLRVSN